MFQLAIIIRLLAFVAFVACVYGGNVLYTLLEHRKVKFLWKIGFVTLYSFFLLMVTYVVCLLLYYKSQRMGIFFVSKQNCPAKQTGQALKNSNQSKIRTRPHRSP